MKNKNQGIWIGEKDLNRDPQFMKDVQNEMIQLPIVDQLGDEDVVENLESNRRDFLKFLGFGLGAATIAASCEIPVKRAIPYVIKPEEIVPGVATYYATSFVNAGDYSSVLVKTREGRPIKIEGNKLCSVSKGTTSARAQASVLSLYDINRYRGPQSKDADGNWADTNWVDLDKNVKAALAASRNIRIVSNTIISPTAKAAVAEFTAKYPGAKHVTYDPVSCSALLDAAEKSFGERIVPGYHFDKADVIVSFDADFLGQWLGGSYAKDYIQNRKIKDVKNPTMSRHYQVESRMSLSGSNCDNRILVKPSEQSAAISYLLGQVGGASLNAGGLNAKAKADLQKIARRLVAAKGKSLVVCGTNNVGDHMMVNAINASLGNIGKTVSGDGARMTRQGSDADLANLAKEMKSGAVDTLIVWDANPVFQSAIGATFAEGLAKVKNKIAFAYTPNETVEACNHIAPIHHYLESWGDAEPQKGKLGLLQPTIKNLFDTRQAELSLLAWADSSNIKADSDQPYFEYLKASWEDKMFAKQSQFLSFNSFWDSALQAGCFDTGASSSLSYSGNASGAASFLTKSSSSELEVSFHEEVVGNGQYANNPWLQELPNSVNRTVWGNYLSVPVKFDGVRTFEGFKDLKDGDLVELTVGDKKVKVAVLQQFGQMPGTVSVALGYGRKIGGFAARNTGVNVNQMMTQVGDHAQFYSSNASISGKVGVDSEFPCVQYHHSMGVTGKDKATGETINADEAATVFFGYGVVDQGFQGSLTERSIIRRSHLDDLKENVSDLHHEREHHQHLNDQTLYPIADFTENKYSQGHYWGMHIDLNACIGCGDCAVACMAENNIPVVGRKQVHRHQEMAWLRIDRYFYGDVDNPNTVYQPMMCQHCDNAPCENVCPVNATNHSSEGLNQMAYNRCIGTRYCANNCPYKVRRFNWLDYTTADIFPANQVNVADEATPFGADNLTRMVLNPDVTVRSRGVIEKCSFCVQRIQEGKLTAKTEGRRLQDSDVRTACQTACPTGAITFGDRNNKKGDLTKKFNDPLNYIVLEEINVRSSVQYTMKVNNRDESLDA